MKQSIVVIALIGLVVLVSGCTIGCNQYAERDVCVEFSYKEAPCISDIIYRVPPNYTGSVDVSIDASDLCYDFKNDPDNLREEVSKLLEEHPDDWNLHINSSEDDVKMCWIKDNTTDKPVREDIFNRTKPIEVCVRTETRLVCVD